MTIIWFLIIYSLIIANCNSFSTKNIFISVTNEIIQMTKLFDSSNEGNSLNRELNKTSLMSVNKPAFTAERLEFLLEIENNSFDFENLIIEKVIDLFSVIKLLKKENNKLSKIIIEIIKCKTIEEKKMKLTEINEWKFQIFNKFIEPSNQLIQRLKDTNEMDSENQFIVLYFELISEILNKHSTELINIVNEYEITN